MMKIAIIGGGNMGASIAAGIAAAGVVAPQRITVSHLKKGLTLPEGIMLTRDNAQAVSGADLIIAAVKPWLMEQVLREIAPHIDPAAQAVASVAAGIDFAQMERWLGTPSPVLFRIVPNTAVEIARGVTFIARKGAGDRFRGEVRSIFEALGSVYEVEERQIRAVTALSSCAIAYALRYIDASAQGGRLLGIEESEALKIVMDTVEGAVCLLKAHGSTPQQEIERVTTPGGITLRGLDAMEKGGFSAAVISGLKASE